MTHTNKLCTALPPLLAAALVAAGCNTGPQQVASMYVKTGTIDSTGGTLTVTSSDDPKLAGTSIYIPAGALPNAVTITIAPSTASVAQTGQTSAGPVVEFGPDGTMFASAATITLPVNAGASDLAIEAVESDGSARQIAIQSSANGFATFLTGTFTRFGGVTSSSDGGSSDGGVECSCPAAPAGVCTTQGPAPCYCPEECDAGVGADCASSADCSATDYCAMSSSCGAGTCQPRPQECPQDCAVPALCGCNGTFECNECLAAAAGTSVAADSSGCGASIDAGSPRQDAGAVCSCPLVPSGACTIVGGGPCFCEMEVPCDGGTSCATATATDCGSTDYCATGTCGAGTCQSKPGACPEYCSEPELCGCDGQLYCNECLANAAGTSVAPDSSGCGGATNTSLDAGVACPCPGIPVGACTVTGPGPCFCPTQVSCDGGNGG